MSKVPAPGVAILMAATLGACGPEFVGSPHGYTVIGSGSVTGISVGIDPTTGGPSLMIGRRTGYVIVAPRLDGAGRAIAQPPVVMCGGASAGLPGRAEVGETVMFGGRELC